MSIKEYYRQIDKESEKLDQDYKMARKKIRGKYKRCNAEIKEQLFPIPDYPGYHASETGEIWSEPRKNRLAVKILKGRIMCGYNVVSLTKNKKVSLCRVSELILLTFIGLPRRGLGVLHRDKNTLNDRLENLQWDVSGKMWRFLGEKI